MPIEAHEEAQGPEVVAGVGRRSPGPGPVDAGARVPHDRIVGAVQELHAELLEEEAHAQGGDALLARLEQAVLVLPALCLLLCMGF